MNLTMSHRSLRSQEIMKQEIMMRNNVLAKKLTDQIKDLIEIFIILTISYCWIPSLETSMPNLQYSDNAATIFMSCGFMSRRRKRVLSLKNCVTFELLKIYFQTWTGVSQRIARFSKVKEPSKKIFWNRKKVLLLK